MADFPTTEEIKDYVNDKTATANYALVEAARYAAIAQLNNDCQRRFVLATTASARVFVPESACLVRIHDCTTVTSVTNDGSAVAASLYQLEPLNGLSAAGETMPYDRIRLISGGVFYANAGEATVSVTATWGWASIPYPIIEACKIIAKDILSNRDVRFGLVAVTDVAGVSARTNPVVAAAINSYKRVEAFGIA